MKNLHWSVWLACATLMSSLVASADTTPTVELPKLVNLRPDKVFTPKGFDNVQVVVTGALPNTCFRAAGVTTEIDKATHKVIVRAQAYYYKGEWCMEVLVPYQHTANLGILANAQYEVVTERNGEFTHAATLPVSVATTSNADDFLYALVKSARVEAPIAEGKPSMLVLEGSLNNTCMFLKEVKTVYRDGNVIEVLPIADVKADGQCEPAAAQKPFTTRVELRPSWTGETLIHVRSLNGQSVNEVADL